jgi:uncharacterized protein with FMN-binding domain
MKKYVLSTIVILSFLIYSFFTRKSMITPVLNNSINQPSSDNSSGAASQSSAAQSSGYKNGTFNGNVADAFYGNIQVAAVIENGKLTHVNILQYPNDRNRSVAINTQALPILESEAIQVQSAVVDMVSGATDTSNAFISSLGSALNQAKN